VCRTDNLTTFKCRLSWNLGAWTYCNPHGLSRAVMGLLLPSSSVSLVLWPSWPFRPPTEHSRPPPSFRTFAESSSFTYTLHYCVDTWYCQFSNCASCVSLNVFSSLAVGVVWPRCGSDGPVCDFRWGQEIFFPRTDCGAPTRPVRPVQGLIATEVKWLECEVHHPRACSFEIRTAAVLPSWPEQWRLDQFYYSLCITNSYDVFPAKLLRNFIFSGSGLCFVGTFALAWCVNAATAVLNFPYSSVRVRRVPIACTVGEFVTVFQCLKLLTHHRGREWHTARYGNLSLWTPWRHMWEWRYGSTDS